MDDAQLVQKWIRQQIIFDQATITYRDLDQEASCGTDRARQLLEEFCVSEDGKSLKVEPTYLIFGTDKKLVGDSIKTSKVERARARELEDLKSKFDSVSFVQIYSISATQAPDANLLKSYTEARISLKPKSKNSTESPKKASQGTDSDPKKESKSTGSKKNEIEEVKKPLIDRTESKPNIKKKDSVGTVVPNKTAGSEPSQKKLNAKNPTKSSKDKGQKAEADDEIVVTVPTKRPASEVDHRKNSTDKKPSAGADSLKTSAKEQSKQKEDPTDTDTIMVVDEGSKPTERKRVTKTRIVRKKKIVRVKDKKGYRVNREEIEEVEETYTDWESSDDHSPQSQNKKSKKPKISQNVKKDENEKMSKEKEAKNSNSTSTTTASSVDQSSATQSASNPSAAKNLSATSTKKKPPTSKQSKEQSNITR